MNDSFKIEPLPRKHRWIKYNENKEREKELNKWRPLLISYCKRWDYKIDDYVAQKPKMLELLYKLFVTLETYETNDEICKLLLHTNQEKLEGFSIHTLCNTGYLHNFYNCREYIIWKLGKKF